LNKNQVVSFEELDFEPLQPFSNPEEILVTKEMHQRLYKAIQSLPPRCKMIFKLVKEDGLSYKEAATVLNLTVGTIDNQLVLAIKKLSRALFYSFSASEKKV
jgi:RNA polymerase sigma-70 factor (ECF subfamily)